MYSLQHPGSSILDVEIETLEENLFDSAEAAHAIDEKGGPPAYVAEGYWHMVYGIDQHLGRPDFHQRLAARLPTTIDPYPLVLVAEAGARPADCIAVARNSWLCLDVTGPGRNAEVRAPQVTRCKFGAMTNSLRHHGTLSDAVSGSVVSLCSLGREEEEGVF
jgi:hypothetical protein